MKIIVRTIDNIITMYSPDGNPTPPEGCVSYTLTPEQEAEFNAIVQEPNGGVMFDGATFGKIAPPPAPPPRASCSPWQFRAELRSRNMLDEVEALVAAQDIDTQEAFKYASEYWSDNPLLLALAAQLSTPLTAEDVLVMITRASKRVVGVPFTG